MKKPRENALRWFRQAEHDLETARRHLDWCAADACYCAEQASQKALKAFLYLRGERSAPEHSVVELARQCAAKDPSFACFVTAVATLDQYYVPTRYPDALADPAVPFETYTLPQAEEAIRLASEIMEAVRKQLGG